MLGSSGDSPGGWLSAGVGDSPGGWLSKRSRPSRYGTVGAAQRAHGHHRGWSGRFTMARVSTTSCPAGPTSLPCAQGRTAGAARREQPATSGTDPRGTDLRRSRILRSSGCGCRRCRSGGPALSPCSPSMQRRCARSAGSWKMEGLSAGSVPNGRPISGDTTELRPLSDCCTRRASSRASSLPIRQAVLVSSGPASHRSR
jgi:hypothetical protein